jgi:hypothetical protein
MVNVIEHEGGRAFVRAPVGAILLDAKGHAVGVRMRRNSVEARAAAHSLPHGPRTQTLISALSPEAHNLSCKD